MKTFSCLFCLMFMANAAVALQAVESEHYRSNNRPGGNLPVRSDKNALSTSASMYHGTRSPVEVIFHTLYVDYHEEYANTIAAINQYYTNWNLTESVTTEQSVFQSELAGKHVFIFPEPELADSAELETLGTEFGPVLLDFVQNGGIVVVLCEWATYQGFMSATGLMTSTFVDGDMEGFADVVEPGHFLCSGLGATMEMADATAWYSTNASPLIRFNDYDVLAVNDIGTGHAVIFGSDFYEFNNDVARVIANAVEWAEMHQCLNHGDVNLDGIISAGDAQMAFLIVLGIHSPTSEEACAADCTGDGIVTAGDAQAIFLTALGTGTCADPLP